MNEQIAAARAHPAVVATMAIAGVTVTACALVAIAYMVGWLPAKDRVPAPAPVPAPVSAAPSGQQVAGTIDLLPGETLVTSPEPPKSAIPQYNPPPPEPPAPAKPASVPPAKATPVAPAKPVARPSVPTYARAAPAAAAPAAPPREAPAPQRDVCANCGTVTTIAPHGDGRWEVRVRFDDGSRETLIFPSSPRVTTGQRVHLEEGRLVIE